MADRVALYLQDTLSMQDSLDYVRYAEARGFDAVWQAETRLSRDAIVPMAAYAASTTRLRIGSGVINNWTRNVATIATTFLTLDDLAPDRIMAGIGTWYEPLASKVGVRRYKHLLAMREVVTNLRKLLNMERVTFQGEFVQLDDVCLDVQHGRKEPRRVPIYIGAAGPKLMSLAGEIADGILLNYMVAPRMNQLVLDQVEQGAKRSNRTVYAIDRPQLIMVSVDNERGRALDAARRLITQYIAFQPDLMRANGVYPELIYDVQQMLKDNQSAQQLDDVMRLVPDDVVQLLTAAGTPDEVREKVREYVNAGATVPVLYPLLPDVRLLIDTFARGYSLP